MTKIRAICHLRSVNSTASGIVNFLEYGDDKVKIHVQITGLGKNKIHAFHIHEAGDLTDNVKFVSLKSHFNPLNQTHGSINSNNRHLGDLGNLKSNASGEIDVTFIRKDIALSGKLSVIGRSCVLHFGIDDLGKGGNEESLKTGNAGVRMLAGVIGYSKNSKLYF